MSTFIVEHDNEIEELANRFASFPNLTKGKICSWLGQFDEMHMPIALKLLQSIRYYDVSKVMNACKSLCELVKTECGQKLNSVYFMGLGHAGKSGDAMLYWFRHANSMHRKDYDGQFMRITEVARLDSEFHGSLVFIDDFIGSGQQASEFLLNVLTVTPPKANLILLVIAGYEAAMQELSRETGCKVFPVDILGESDKLFSDGNSIFTTEEKSILKDYCIRTGSSLPFGYNDISSLVIFSHGAPNNTPSILIHQGEYWKALFPRGY